MLVPLGPVPADLLSWLADLLAEVFQRVVTLGVARLLRRCKRTSPQSIINVVFEQAIQVGRRISRVCLPQLPTQNTDLLA